MRPALPLAAIAALVLVGLTGCTSTSSSAANKAGTATSHGCPAAASGSASEGIKVSGKAKAAPTVAFGTPLKASTTQRTVLTAGKGAAVTKTDSVNIRYELVNGTTGKSIGSVGYGSDPAQEISLTGLQVTGLTKVIECTKVGSRVAGVIPPADAFGSTGSTQLGIGKSDDLVVVIDVVSIVKPLKPVAWTSDLPTVDQSGATPVITLPSVTPPTALEERVLTDGTGATVKSGDSVTVDYQGVSWSDGKVFDQSFGKTPATFPTSGVVPGFAAAMIGQKVGSTVIVTIPAKDAYGPKTSSSTNALAGQTLVFLIKIEKTASA